MGNCCHPSEEGNLSLNREDKSHDRFPTKLDYGDRLQQTILIQAALRRYLASKKVKKLHAMKVSSAGASKAAVKKKAPADGAAP